MLPIETHYMGHGMGRYTDMRHQSQRQKSQVGFASEKFIDDLPTIRYKVVSKETETESVLRADSESIFSTRRSNEV